MPQAGVFKLKREESAPALDGIMVAAVPVPVVEVVEGEVLVGVTAVVKGLVEVEDLHHYLATEEEQPKNKSSRDNGIRRMSSGGGSPGRNSRSSTAGAAAGRTNRE